MATSQGISKAVDLLAAAFATFRKSAELAGVLAELLEPYTDDEVVQAAKRIIGSSTKAPAIAELVSTTRAISLSKSEVTSDNPDGRHYVEYWDRPKSERDEIDKARRECMEMAKRLGMDMDAIFKAPAERSSPEDDQDKYWKGR